MKGNVIIEFGPKFCQAQFEDFLKTRIWEKSFAEPEITTVFDLTLTEWISTEQICFLFAWIRNLKLLRREVKVKLPFRTPLAGIYSSAHLKHLSEKYKNFVSGQLYIDNESRVKRRRRSAAFLMDVYGMFSRLNLSESDFDQMADYATYNAETRRIRENNHQIIGFTPFELRLTDSGVKYDTHFFELISDTSDTMAKTKGLFELQENIQNLLKKYGCYNPFESKILSNVITQELFTNSLQHSFDENLKKLFPECYITAFLANKWEGQLNPSFQQIFLTEKYPETFDFFKDKERISAAINKMLKDPKNKNMRSRSADLRSFKAHFKNQSYLEYTFVDFGDGIHHTLEPEFDKQVDDKKLPLDALSPDFMSANKHSQIIEYAFLMDSSKNSLDKRIEYFDLVPRGLYFLTDMIRRYKGLLIVRSGNGKVIYDFSDKIKIEQSDAGSYARLQSKFTIADSVKHSGNHDLPWFPGTLFTVVLPGVDKKDESRDDTKGAVAESSLGAVRTDDPQLAEYAYSVRDLNYELQEYPAGQFRASQFRYAGILLLYNAILEKLKKSDGEIAVKDIYTRLLIAVNSIIDEAKGANCIIFFDFAGLRSGNALWIKILYYLINTPKINEKTKAIIFNLPSDEQRIVGRIKENLAGYDMAHVKKRQLNLYEPFLFKPIPCIRAKIDAKVPSQLVEWIGLKNAADELLLTSLFLGIKDQYNVSKFESAANAIGNLIVHDKGWIKSTFSGLVELNKLFLSRQKQSTIDFLKSHIVNGVEHKLEDGQQVEIEHTVFLTANGGFQLQYLTLYELLHDKYIARYFAKCLLDKYATYVQLKLSSGEPGTFDDIWQYSFTKIIAVTVSSQLIGIAIRDLIVEDDCYDFLRKKTKLLGSLDLAPELIMLSSYYSFDVEKPFEKIIQEDRVLIVNDVISTGKLVGKLLTKIEDEKNARINSVFSISDTRVPLSEKKTHEKWVEEDCKFFERFESRFITLADFDDGIELRKFTGPYKGAAEPKRINPLLNTIVELKVEHGEQQKVLFNNITKFWKDLGIDEDYLKIGHFQQNMTHNGYLTNVRSLFSSDKGVGILEKIKAEIERKGFGTASGSPRRFIINRLASLDQQFGKVALGLRNEKYIEKANEIRQAIMDFHSLLTSEESFSATANHYRPDFIFYPVFSGIERTNYLKISEIFHTHPDNIIGLQRFDTPKGWRFPFPAKRYNEVTRNQSILILDAGSLTGESLVQLIDNIGFLDVKEILVLSVISRVEDFYREFYSRLKSLNVKKLKSKDKSESSSLFKSENIVPIEIVFGISLHIPVYSSAASCPFCEESNKLNAISDSSHYARQTHQVSQYIKKRKEELSALNNATDVLENISYLPLERLTSKVDTRGIFDTRDFLGKIDSYRFYPEYFSDLNDLQESIIKNENWLNDQGIKESIERILICVLHEASLLELIESYGNGLEKNLVVYVKKYVFASADVGLEFHYKWSRYAQLQLAFIILKKDILSKKIFFDVLEWDDEDCHLLMHFKLWDILYGKQSKQEDRDLVERLLKDFTDLFIESEEPTVVFSAKNKEYARILIRNSELSDIGIYSKLDIPFYNLSKFVYQGQLQERHFFLKESLNYIIDAIISTNLSIEQIKSKVHDVLYIFDDELRPSIEKIVRDPAIRDNCKVVYSLLSDEKKGILYYMNKLETAYQQIVNVKQEKIDSVKHIFPVLKDIALTMVNKVLATTEEKESFYRVCKEYPWNLAHALSDIQAKQSTQAAVTFSIDEELAGLQISMHRYVIDAIFEEIVKNGKKRYERGLEINFLCERSPGGEYIKLTVTQNYAFVKPEKEKTAGGLCDIVQHFAEKFAGSFSDNREESLIQDIDFEIYLLLKIHSYVK